MNKTIIININGMVFHIEEDAYEILKNYMTEVKRHFLNSADSLEITTDIENRIAEMFSDLLINDHKQVIVEADVRSVIDQMGTVADFEQAEDENAAPVTSIPGYTNANRSLFRDPDEHLLGGVCAGLANYFGIRSFWVRVFFTLLIMIFGIGLISYVILWIVVPKAVTRADRMAMKGERLDLQGFKNNLEEEMNAVRHSLNDKHRRSKPAIYKIRDLFSDLFYHLGKFFSSTGKILVKVLGVVILLSCVVGIVAMVVMLAAVIVFGQEPDGMFPLGIIDSSYASIIYITAFVTGVIPVIAIAMLTVMAVFKVRSINWSSGAVLFVVWLFSIGTMLFYISKVMTDFRASASFSQTTTLKATGNNKYYLKLNNVKYLTSEDSARLDIKQNFNNNVVVTNEHENYTDFRDLEENQISIRIEKSDVSQPVLIQSFRSKGKNYDDALYNARNTHYTFAQQDTVLKFDRRIRRLNGVKWRDQQVELTLKVPVNAVVVIDNDLQDMVRDIDLYACRAVNKTPDARLTNFMMTANGLTCKVDTLVTVPVDSLVEDSVIIPVKKKFKRATR